MTARRRLIVNADAFGQSAGVNRGIIEAHEGGIVTSASLMVGWPAAQEAASYARSRAGLSLGLHVDLAEWAFRAGAWEPLYIVVPLDDGAAIASEAARQIARFRDLVGRDPSHLDSHQDVHMREPARGVILREARRLSVPLRHVESPARSRGDFYGQTAEGAPRPEAISAGSFLELLRSFPEGVTELFCHPGFADDLDTMYSDERALEVAVLCDPRIRAEVGLLGISLENFEDLAPLARDVSGGPRTSAGGSPLPDRPSRSCGSSSSGTSSAGRSAGSPGTISSTCSASTGWATKSTSWKTATITPPATTRRGTRPARTPPTDCGSPAGSSSGSACATAGRITTRTRPDGRVRRPGASRTSAATRISSSKSAASTRCARGSRESARARSWTRTPCSRRSATGPIPRRANGRRGTRRSSRSERTSDRALRRFPTTGFRGRPPASRSSSTPGR